jgi:hypothetical protein
MLIFCSYFLKVQTFEILLSGLNNSEILSFPKKTIFLPKQHFHNLQNS